jgi:aerobic carbon-monoxide dehydrogenase large subunit
MVMRQASNNSLPLSAIGRPIRRKEDERLLTGRGRFCDDFTLPGQVYAVMVRSIWPHARIRDIDAARARSMGGVIAVFTGADCRADGLQPIPHDPVPSPRSNPKLVSPGGGDVFAGPHEPLPTDKARHVGEALAMVVAETLPQAVDAAEAVEVDYEPLPWVADSVAAAVPGAPCIWDEMPDNVCVDTTFGDEAATHDAFERADHVVAMEFRIGRVTGVPLEPRAALGSYDGASGRYTLYESSNGAVRHKHQVAAVLAIEPDRLRVLCHDVGGSFGTKNRVYVEQPLVLWAARKIGRPVKFVATRCESFLSDYQGRDLVSTVKLALSAQGRFLALRASNLSNVGSRAVSFSPLGKGIALVTGPYAIPSATARARAVFTNTVPTQAYRSSGRPEVTHALERLIDSAAHDFGFDRVELRRKNLIPAAAMPYTNAVGMTYDSGEYESNMDRAIQLADWQGFAARKADAQARGKCLGIGLANYVESSIGNPRERADITIKPDGEVELVIGTQPSGQGHETSFAQVASALLGVSMDAVKVVLGDTDIVKAGGGSHSGRSMRHASAVIYLAAEELIAKGKELAAGLFGVEPPLVMFGEGTFKHGGRSIDWFGLARETAREGGTAARGFSVSKQNEMHTPVFPNGCAVCEVEVDPETGFVEIIRYVSVDDVGRVINPLIVDGQTHGSIAQGVGQALWERCYVDPDSGQPLCGSLMDYALPRADNLPSFVTELNEVLSPTNPLGVKSAGEGPTTAALAVVVNAIVDALREYGVRDIELPATPFRVWQAIRDARQRAAAS